MATSNLLQTGEAPIDLGIGRDNAALGPSDTSDSGSDVPASYAGRDTDSQGTGDRASVDPIADEAPEADDLDTDTVVGEEEAGLAHTEPDPARNGGPSDDVESGDVLDDLDEDVDLELDEGAADETGNPFKS